MLHAIIADHGNHFCRGRHPPEADAIRKTMIKIVKRSSFSTGQLKRLHAAHLRPINLVVFQGTSTKPYLGTGFVLICFQHLSEPYVATLRCLERDNRNTRGTSLQILSY